MSTQTIRNEQGFLDTRRVREGAPTRGFGRVRGVLGEAAGTLRGIFEAPLRYALGPQGDEALQALDETTRRDIGL